MLVWSLALSQVLLTAFFTYRSKAFTKRFPVLAMRQDMDRYRSFVAGHMWAALAMMALSFALPIAIGLHAIGGGGVQWWPMSVMLLPVLLRSRIGAIEGDCRKLQVTPELVAEYEAINRIWIGKALPRFPAPQSFKSAATQRAHDARGDQSVIDDVYDDDMAMRWHAHVLIGLGLSEATYGSMVLCDPQLSELHALGLALLALGGITFAGAMLLSWRLRIGYRISLVCAVLQWFVPPLGTALGIWSFISMRRSARAVSSEYLEAMSGAKEQVRLPWLRYVLVGTAIVLVNGGLLFAASVSIILSSS